MIKYIVDVNHKKEIINKNIYGHFSEHLGRCIYEGIYVGEESGIPHVNGMRTDVVEALKGIKVPVLRWPGGCFADEYHWKDGIGPKENRKKAINTHWGGVIEDNSFGTHEFMELCRQIGCEPYINGNLGSGTVQEMSEWVEYLTHDGISPMADQRRANGQDKPWEVKYFGVGNENWGCGGNMRPEYYADEYRRYQTYLRNYGNNKLYKIACGACVDDYNWTKVLMESATKFMDALTLHHYAIPGGFDNKMPALGFDEEAYYLTLKHAAFMEELLDKHIHIMDTYDKDKRIALIVDEWGSWYQVEPGTNPGFLYQQNTMRDAMIAGMTLNIFNKHADRVRMANIAQVVNVLQAVILTEGANIVLTPTYHVFDLYKVHQNARLLESFISRTEVGSKENAVWDLYESASIDESGHIHVTICNTDLKEEKVIEGILRGYKSETVKGRMLTGKMDAHNTFEHADAVKIVNLTNVMLNKDAFQLTVPPCSIVQLAFTGA
ncbi:alpha-N-arabinofuranosidase [Cellulosilyticum sp. I15G10I2]|uniref:alpha-N-arabinofuranosidase n=1 Tax=Cellulosilyticum sp. I15G10I2 TaxID=1892843 RepID=UPI00085BB7F9|nr:alpha-L-arabinofuranosidase C-terminal domain-containing protein [Cellulosilyticum sp. I15G10I2]